jgi:hypothetical protein
MDTRSRPALHDTFTTDLPRTLHRRTGEGDDAWHVRGPDMEGTLRMALRS